MKLRYDNKHKSLLFKIDDITYFGLHYDYKIFNRFNKKLSNQYVDLFLIKRKIEKLTYKINSLLNFKMHFMMLIIRFESTNVIKKIYCRFKSNRY